MGADVGGHDHVAIQHVALAAHAPELERRRHRDHRAVTVGDEADLLGARADSAEVPHDTPGWVPRPPRVAHESPERWPG